VSSQQTAVPVPAGASWHGGEAVYVKDFLKGPRFLDANTAKLAKSMLVFGSLGFVGYAVYVGRAGTARGKVDRTLIEPITQAILERNTWSSIRHYRERLEKRCHRAARTAYSHVPSPFKALYRRSPLRDLHARYRRSFWRARGRWE